MKSAGGEDWDYIQGLNGERGVATFVLKIPTPQTIHCPQHYGYTSDYYMYLHVHYMYITCTYMYITCTFVAFFLRFFKKKLIP